MYTPIVYVISEEYLPDNLTVTVEWSEQVGVTYTTRIIPEPILSTGKNNSRQVILQYNTNYNLSVVAVTPCRNATAFIGLSYGINIYYFTTERAIWGNIQLEGGSIGPTEGRDNTEPES